jgi:hypothetical protein
MLWVLLAAVGVSSWLVGALLFTLGWRRRRRRTTGVFACRVRAAGPIERIPICGATDLVHDARSLIARVSHTSSFLGDAVDGHAAEDYDVDDLPGMACALMSTRPRPDIGSRCEALH